jgi:hypothetical protein
MNTARLLVPIFTLQVFLYLLLDFLLAGYRIYFVRRQEQGQIKAIPISHQKELPLS